MVEEPGADGGEHAAQRPARGLQGQRMGPWKVEVSLNGGISQVSKKGILI